MLQKGHKCGFFVDFFANKSDTLTHGKSSQHSADAEAGYMAEEEESHAGCDDQAGHVVADFYFRIGFACISSISRGNKSVGVIGSLQRLERAMPKHKIR